VVPCPLEILLPGFTGSNHGWVLCCLCPEVRVREVNSHGSRELTACMGPGSGWLLCSQQPVSYCSVGGLDFFKPLLWKEKQPWCCFLSQMPAGLSACLANPVVRRSPPQAGRSPQGRTGAGSRYSSSLPCSTNRLDESPKVGCNSLSSRHQKLDLLSAKR